METMIEKQALHVFRIEDGATTWVVAADDEDAVDAHREAMSMTREQYLEECCEEPEVTQMKPHELVKVTGLRGTTDEPGFPPELLQAGSWSVEFSAEALSKHHQRGVVCSTEF